MLARIDQVRVLDQISVRFVDPAPLVSVPILAARDRRQRVSLDHDVVGVCVRGPHRGRVAVRLGFRCGCDAVDEPPLRTFVKPGLALSFQLSKIPMTPLSRLSWLEAWPRSAPWGPWPALSSLLGVLKLSRAPSRAE